MIVHWRTQRLRSFWSAPRDKPQGLNRKKSHLWLADKNVFIQCLLLCKSKKCEPIVLILILIYMLCVASGSCLAMSAQMSWDETDQEINYHWFQVDVIKSLNGSSCAGFLYSLEYLFLLLLILLVFRDRKQRRLQQQRKLHPKIGFALFQISSLLFQLF